jgi:hypothetical protein
MQSKAYVAGSCGSRLTTTCPVWLTKRSSWYDPATIRLIGWKLPSGGESDESSPSRARRDVHVLRHRGPAGSGSNASYVYEGEVFA